MWKVDRPSFSADETFRACISRIRRSGLHRRLKSVEPVVAAAEKDYEQKASARALNLVAPSASVGGIVSKEEMIKVYDQRMAAKLGPGRVIYDQIKLLPRGDRCPFCGQRNVSTLDHILPKAHYPVLAVTPLNLVAACAECNKAKLSRIPKTAAEVMIHPYFDDITNEQWLVASLIQTIPCAFVFDVSPPAAWDTLTESRVRQQFSLLGLSDLYSSEAATELANIRHNLQMHFQAGGSTGVREELHRQWQSRRAYRLNSWQTAMYEAAASDSWFFSGGFL
jgi:hypothetical protein